MSESEFGEQRDRRRDAAEEAEGASFADVLNGFTFDSGRKRNRRKRAEPAEEPQQQPEQRAEPEPPAGGGLPPRVAGRPPAPQQPPPGGWATGPQGAVPPPQQPPQAPDWGSAGPARGVPAAPEQAPAWGAADQREWPAQDEEQEAPAASSIRSYTWTGGRTRSNYELQMETLVSTSETYRPGSSGRMEHESIAELCRHPRSVAEVGALLSVPIGVARVLLADMAELGMITVHQTVTESGSAPHLMLMERVLSGLRRL